MKSNVGWIIVGLLVAVSPCVGASVASNQAASAPLPKLAGNAFLVEVTRDESVTEDQKTRLLEAIEAEERAIDQWVKSESGRKAAGLREDLQLAARNKETSKVEALRQEMKPLLAQREEIRRKGRLKCLAVLSPRQRENYFAAKLEPRITLQFPLLTLTEEQKQDVRELCREAIADQLTTAALERDPFYPQLGDDVIQALKHRVQDSVLTDKQRSFIAWRAKKDGRARSA
jgi:Spy/CpxP family protein refolding chaperone